MNYSGVLIREDSSGNSIPIDSFTMLPETAESWNAKCRAQFLRYYVQEHGHEPNDFEAEYAKHVNWAYAVCGSHQ